MTTTVTITLDDSLKQKLDAVAASTHRPESAIAVEAIRNYLDLQEWQTREIELAVREADAGDFASEQEVQDVLKKWGVNES